MIEVKIRRGDQIESVHEIKALVFNSKQKIIFSTDNNQDITFGHGMMNIVIWPGHTWIGFESWTTVLKAHGFIEIDRNNR